VLNVFQNAAARFTLFALLAGLLVVGGLMVLAPESELADFANVIGLGGLLGAVIGEAIVRWARAPK
jgi:membrane associated rhomboid family serine protease